MHTKIRHLRIWHKYSSFLFSLLLIPILLTKYPTGEIHPGLQDNQDPTPTPIPVQIEFHTTPLEIPLDIETGPVQVPIELQIAPQTTPDAKQPFKDLADPIVGGLLAVTGTIIGAIIGFYYTKRSQVMTWQKERRETRYTLLSSTLDALSKDAQQARHLSLKPAFANQLNDIQTHVFALQTNINSPDFSDAYASIGDDPLQDLIDKLETLVLALPTQPSSLYDIKPLIKEICACINEIRRRVDIVITSGETS